MLKNISRTLLILSALSCLQIASAQASNRLLSAIGEARNPNTGELLYLEHHYQTADSKTMEIEYLYPSNRTFAVKSLDFSSSNIAPSFTLTDMRFDQSLSASWNNSELLLSRGKLPTIQTKSITTSKKETLVVDAGFDAFIRQHWSALAQGETVKFDFAVPARLGSVKLSAQQVSCEEFSEGHSCFTINASNRLLRLVLPAIQLAYEDANQRLLSFQGLSNLENDDGDGQLVHITYQHFEQESPGLACNGKIELGSPSSPTARVQDCIVSTYQGKGPQIDTNRNIRATLTGQNPPFML